MNNTQLLERVIQAVSTPKLIHNINLTEEGRRIRFNYGDVRYVVYHSGHVTISEPGIEIGARPEADEMKRLLNI